MLPVNSDFNVHILENMDQENKQYPMQNDRSMKATLGILLSCCAIPLITLLCFIAYFAVDMPYQDSWIFITTLMKKYFADQLSAADILRMHNEHRHVASAVLFLIVGVITDWNELYFVFCSAAICFAAYLLCALRISQTELSKYRFHLFCFMTSIVMFSIVPVWNWTWGFQVQWHFCILGVVTGLFIVTKSPYRPTSLMAGLACGLFATLSSAGGLMYWPIFGLTLSFFTWHKTRSTKTTLWVTVGWLVLASLMFNAYFWDYERPALHPDNTLPYQHPIKFVMYVFAYLGAPFSAVPIFKSKLVLSNIIGACGTMVFLFYLYRTIREKLPGDIRIHLFFLAIGAFGIACACATAIGRAGMGLEQALAFRYIPNANLLWVCLIYFILLGDTRITFTALKRSVPMAKTISVATLLVLLFISSISVIPMYKWKRDKLICARTAIVNAQSDECLKLNHPNPSQIIKHVIPYLSERKLSIFKQQ